MNKKLIKKTQIKMYNVYLNMIIINLTQKMNLNFKMMKMINKKKYLKIIKNKLIY